MTKNFILIFFIPFTAFAQIDHWEKLVGESDTWSYRLGNSEPNSSWIDTSFNASDTYIPNAGSSNSTPIIIDADQQQGALTLSPGTSGQESVIIAANGPIQIDTSNVTGPQSIEILAGGAIIIKYYQDAWYVVGYSNSNVTY